MRLIRLLALSLWALALAAGAACGGGDALSLEEYFTKMDAIDKDANQQFDSEEVFSQDNTAQETADAFVGIVRGLHDDYAELKPPKDSKDAHEQLVSAIDDAIEVIEGVEFEADAPADAIFESPEVTEALGAVDEALCAIESIADDKGIEADVGCPENEDVDPSTLEPVEEAEVLIQDFAFDPPHIQVSVGDTVTWTQGASDAPHTATADDDSFDSDTLSEEGETFEFTLEEPGEFPYSCAIHPDMLGLVTVVD